MWEDDQCWFYSDLYSLDLRRDHYLDRAMYEGGGSPMKRGTWVFLCGVE